MYMYLPADNCLFSRTSLYPSPYTVVFFNKHACLLEKSSLYVFQKVYTFWRIDDCLSLWLCPYSFMDIPVFLHNHRCIFSNKQWCMVTASSPSSRPCSPRSRRKSQNLKTDRCLNGDGNTPSGQRELAAFILTKRRNALVQTHNNRKALRGPCYCGGAGR